MLFCALISSGFLLQCKDMQVRLKGNTNLPIGVNASVTGASTCKPTGLVTCPEWSPPLAQRQLGKSL